MTRQEIDKAKTKDLSGSLVAIQRAVRMAHERAIRTNTTIIVMRNNKLTHLIGEKPLETALSPSDDVPNLCLPRLTEFRATLPEQTVSAGDFIRAMRDGDRY
ncbi:hypothetical protein CCP3SC1_890011 [Gammaproteobacteria bacterium]